MHLYQESSNTPRNFKTNKHPPQPYDASNLAEPLATSPTLQGTVFIVRCGAFKRLGPKGKPA